MGKKTKVTVETMAFESNELKMSSVSETMTADNNMLKGAALEKSTLGKASLLPINTIPTMMVTTGLSRPPSAWRLATFTSSRAS